MMVALPLLSLWGILQIPLIQGFLPTPATQCRIPDARSTSTRNSPAGWNPSAPTRPSSQLFVDLWERMEIEEDEEPYWYLLNCVAGLEMDLLNQVRQVAEGLTPADVIKFVVPTEVKTRSHGASRMVRETKTKYQGYVFAKLRLTKETYTAIQKIDLCRSWMGTINMKGYKKLPPAPLPLSEEEIENFDLENPKWELEEQEAAAAAEQEMQGIILDTYENDQKEMEEVEAIEETVRTVYKSLAVEDMIKVTAKNKFNGEDGIVKRLKEGKVLIRFFTYGQTFDEWLDPSDVRKLTDEEILKGLGGPSAPITQRDLDGDRDNEERPQRRFDARNSVGAFGGGPSRDRRQDREERRFRRDPMSEGKERENWNWYKENEKRSQGGGYDDGDGVEFRAQSQDSRQRGNDRNNFWEGDVDSQWGRNKGRRQQRNDRDEDDWSSFVSDGKRSKPKNAPSKEETDDFFASLMSDLSKDTDGGNSGGRRQEPAATDDDDDFFASLMSEIEDKPSDRGQQQKSSSRQSNDDDDDFFASLEREIRGSDSGKPSKPKKKEAQPAAVSSEEDDFFASLEMELTSDLNTETQSAPAIDKTAFKTQSAPAIDNTASSDEDDFFSSLEADLRTDLDADKPSETSDEDDFFSSLEADLRTDLDADKPSETSDEDDFFSSLEADLRTDLDADEPSETIPVPKAASPPKKKETTEAPKTVFDAASLKKKTVPELKDILRDRGLKVSGKKAELIERITSA